MGDVKWVFLFTEHRESVIAFYITWTHFGERNGDREIDEREDREEREKEKREKREREIERERTCVIAVTGAF